MKRALKESIYRAWHKEEKNMYVVLGIDWFNQQVLIDSNGLIAWHQMDHFELMRYSELPDCKGQKLYEGDIIQFPLNFVGGKKEIVKDVVAFDKSTGMFVTVYCDADMLALHNDESLRIGTIHENPELANNLDVA